MTVVCIKRIFLLGVKMEKWYVATKKADFSAWARELSVDPVVARILRNRDMTNPKEARTFLYGELKDCHSPWLLRDMDRAVGELLRAVRTGRKIRVIGDYDVDGICSAYILTKGLLCLGADVDTAIPHRIHDGYGLNDHLIELAKEDGVEMILTCDNGIAAGTQIALADSLGICVIVTDHHEVPFEADEKTGERRDLLPPALAVVDPKRSDDTYPFPGICGGVVAYKLMAAVADILTKEGDAVLPGSATVTEKLRGELEEFLEFAAFATVCDVMELKDENRILVKEGLHRMRNSHNPGLRALMEVNEIAPENLSAYHLGFVLGPCLNATGRLDTAARALELLMAEDKQEAMCAARELKELNDSRKNLTRQGEEEAEVYLQTHNLAEDKVYVIFLPEVHESLAGIIAGRIREKYNHPVFVLTRGEDGVKGSGRSVEGYHMFEEMTRVKECFTRFGGHKMAAGLSMREEDIALLRKKLNENCTLKEEDFVSSVHIDVPMPLSYANEQLAAQLELLEPFGVGNPKPLFAQKDVIFRAGYHMGKNGAFSRFQVQTPEGDNVFLVYFGDGARFEAFLDEKYGPGSCAALFQGGVRLKVSVVYQLNRNTYKGHTQVQYVMTNYC